MDFHIHKPQDAAGGGESVSQSHTGSKADAHHEIRRVLRGTSCPSSQRCHQREHEAGTACPCTGWLSAAGHRLYCPQSWRLNCRLALPAVHKRCPDGKREFSRDLPLFPCSCRRTGRKTTELCSNAHTERLSSQRNTAASPHA